MKFIKMENGWRSLEDASIFHEFGEITIDVYNFFNDNLTKYEQILEERKLTSEEEKKYRELRQDSEPFMSIINFYIGDLYFSNEAFPAIRDYKPLASKYHTKHEQDYWHKEKVRLARIQGWHDITDSQDFNIVDYYLMKAGTEIPPFLATSHFINGKWYMAYDSEDTNKLLLLDIQEMRNSTLNFSFCENCQNIFIRKNKKVKYCSNCQSEYRKNYDKKRAATPKGKQKKVADYMKNSNKFSEFEINNFWNESNYYWDILNGKQIEPNSAYNANICTEADFLSWLEEQHKNFKSHKKH